MREADLTADERARSRPGAGAELAPRAAPRQRPGPELEAVPAAHSIGRPDTTPISAPSVVALQRMAGNTAVAEFVMQRQPAPPAFDVTEFIDDPSSPGLTAAVATRARDALAANRRQEALNLVVDELVTAGAINRALLRGGRMRYDPGLAGEGAAAVPRFRLVNGRRVANPTRVRLGPSAFRGGLPLLYSSILHEYRHVEQFQRIYSAADPLSGQNDWLEDRQEVDAYLHEIENARTTGMFANPRQMREAWRRLHAEHWINVDRAGRRILNDRYTAAHAIVRQSVGPDVRLGFSPL